MSLNNPDKKMTKEIRTQPVDGLHTNSLVGIYPWYQQPLQSSRPPHHNRMLHTHVQDQNPSTDRWWVQKNAVGLRWRRGS